ncbi:hypothetical protein [Halovenus sp. HT40]|uniref:hypothetical protein n=1 Tax=Halovenus sp. HT40 TaxID=3126691 RepID=UPI00300EAC96
MLHGDSLGLLVGAVGLGAIHGIEPGHGWPVAASYALDQGNKWLSGMAASLLIGIGHLVSSIAMVAVFFYAKGYFSLTQVDEPITILGGVQIGGPVSIVAGLVLVALGVREYFHGHSHGTSGDGHSHEHESGHGHEHAESDHNHGHTDDHDHEHTDDHDHDHEHTDDHDHNHAHHEHAADNQHDEHTHDDGGLRSRLVGFLPFVGGHSHGTPEDAADRGLFGIAWFAFLLGFAHEEEFEIIALCAGSTHCLELMTAYALTVIVGIVALTMALIAGYHAHEETVERYTPYLPVFSAIVLVTMGLGFIAGVF